MERAFKNIMAERIIIGTLINNPKWLLEINNLSYNHFFMFVHKVIFFTIQRLLQEGVDTIDSFTILSRVEKMEERAVKSINENGGIEYLEMLREVSKDYTLNDLQHAIDEVIACSFKEEQGMVFKSVFEEMQTKPEMSVEQVIQMNSEKQVDLQNKYISNMEVKPIGEVLDSVLEDIERNQINGNIGIPSKIPLINKYYGYQNGELVVLGARAKYGKSNYAVNEAHFLGMECNVPVAIFDTEMKTRTFTSRILALDSGVPITEIQNGSYKNHFDKSVRVENSIEKLRKAPIIHKYNPFWDKPKVASTAKLLKIKNSLGLLIYDYIKVKEVSGNMKEHSELGNWTIFLKDLAGELDIPILTFAQLSPYERRLADSDKINRYASVVGYLLPKSGQQIIRDMGAEQGGTDYLYVDYNRLGESMTDPDFGINLIYTRYLAKFEQAPVQPLVQSYDD